MLAKGPENIFYVFHFAHTYIPTKDGCHNLHIPIVSPREQRQKFGQNSHLSF